MFVLGVAVAVIVDTGIWFLVAGTLNNLGDPSDNGSKGHVIQYVLVALLVLLALRTYRNRAAAEPPKWMGSLLEATPRRALTLGLLLISLMPSDIVVMITVGVHLQHEGKDYIDAGLFMLATILIVTVVKSGVAYGMMRLFRYPESTALMIAASRAQVGEFSFILAGLGVALSVLPTVGRDLILAAALISILLTPFLFVAADAVEEIKDGIFFVSGIARRGIDESFAFVADRL